MPATWLADNLVMYTIYFVIRSKIQFLHTELQDIRLLHMHVIPFHHTCIFFLKHHSVVIPRKKLNLPTRVTHVSGKNIDTLYTIWHGVMYNYKRRLV